jgi:hypothetical protein
MSEAVRIESIHLIEGYDVVFLAKTNILKVSTVDIMKEVRVSLREVGLMK